MSSSAKSAGSRGSGFQFELVDVVGILKRRWVSLLLGLAIGVSLGIAYYGLVSRKYESSAQILVMRKDSRMATRGTDSSDQPEAQVSEDLLSTHMQILQSPEIVQSALRKGRFDELPSIVNKLEKDQTPVDFIIDRLTVTRGGTGQSRMAHVLNISLRHTSEEETKLILNGIIESYRTFLGAKFQDVSQEAASLILRAKVELSNDLKTAESTYRVFRENASMLFKGDESANIHRVRYEELQGAISAARLKASTIQARLEVVEFAIQDQNYRALSDVEQLALLDEQDVERLTSLVEVDKGDANSAEFQSSQPMRLEMARAQHESLMKLLMQEKSLSADLGPDHPQLQVIRNQISAAQSFFTSQEKGLGAVNKKPKLTSKTIVEAYRGLLKQDLSALQKHQLAMEKLAVAEADAAKKLVSDELRGEALRKDVERIQLLYDTVLERLREINLVKDYGGFVTEVIAPVETGIHVSPKISLSLLGGLLIGLVIGGTAVGFSEFRDRSFHNVEALRAAVDLPIISTIPSLPSKLSDEEMASAGDAQRSPSLVTYYRSRSREAEVFRGLRTALILSAKDGGKQVIACSSPTMGDGKSTVLANIAISMALSGKRVLLVDCDMRRPTVHHLFHLSNDAGLAEIVSGQVDPPDAIQTTDIENLSLITCGHIPSNPAELLSSVAFEEFLASCREKFDFVLLDCPPVLAVSDPCIVAPKTDMMLVVVNLQNNARPQVLRTQEMLHDLGAPVVGLIVNGVQDQHRTGYDRYAYGYGYGYGQQSEPSSRYYVESSERGNRASSNTLSEGSHARMKAASHTTNGHSSS